MLYQALELRRSCYCQKIVFKRSGMFSVVILVSGGTLFIWVLALGNTPWVCYIQGFSSIQKSQSQPHVAHTCVHTHTHQQERPQSSFCYVRQSMSDVQCIDRASVCQADHSSPNYSPSPNHRIPANVQRIINNKRLFSFYISKMFLLYP